jgi:N-methylhydantoinase A
MGNLEDRLREVGFGGRILVFTSQGGVLDAKDVARTPIHVINSGPAMAPVVGRYFADLDVGAANAIVADTGGTTYDVSLIRNREIPWAKETWIGQPFRGHMTGFPSVDVKSVGAGGGSIAWVDTGGALRVGPVSAGADPGPVAYGRGGTEPTVTDANLVLGRLGAESLLGGELKLDVEAAQRAIRDRCADRLGLDVTTAAYGIIEIANAAMASALRLMSVQRGLDPRGFGLVGFGGAGPVHVNRLAQEMGIVRTIVPPSPGTFSALGLLLNDLRHDYSQTFLRRTESADVEQIAALLGRLETEGRAMLRREGVDDADVRIEVQAEMQYVGQSYVLPIDLPGVALTRDDLTGAVARFHTAHEQAYGFAAPAEPTEIVNVRLGAVGRIPPWEPRTLAEGDRRAIEPKTTRQAYFAEAGGFTPTPIYDRSTFVRGAVLSGPCIIEEMDSTTVVHPGYRAVPDAWGNLVISPSEEPTR